MSDNSPGPSSTAQLVTKAKKKNIDLCMICKHRLCSTDNFVSTIFSLISEVWSRLHHRSVGRV